MSILGFDIELETVIIGIITGLAYAVLAAGIVLVYRATRVINFAAGEMGAFGATLLAKLVLDYDWNFVLAFLAATAVGGIIGGIIELVVVRRLFNAPRLILMVATIGVAQVLFFAQVALPDAVRFGAYPTAIHRSREIGGFLLRGEHFMVLAVVPTIIVGLTLFLNRTPYGIAIRSTAENADAARLLGISPKRVSTVVWVLAGVLATVTTVMINPIKGTIVGLPSVAIGPGLLLRALAAALVGRLVSLPKAMAGGIAIGVIEALLFRNFPGDPGLVDAVLAVVVVLLVLARGRGFADDTSSWSLSPRVAAVPERLRAVPWVRLLPAITVGAVLAAAVALPLVVTSASRTYLFSNMLIFALIGLSVTVLTGWAGQLSFGQFAFVGLGAMTTGALHQAGLPFAAAVVAGTAAGVAAALVVGTPALRVQGLFLAVTTLAFAVAAPWLLSRSVFVGDGDRVHVSRGQLGPIDFKSQRAYYYLCLVVVAVAFVVVARTRRGGIGRMWMAVRDNERGASAMTVSPERAKLRAFAVAGGLAALAGGLLMGLRVDVGAADFGPAESLRIVAMAVIGGLGSLVGAVLGAVYLLGLPAIFGDTVEIRLLTSGAGLLVLLLYFPGGLAGVVYRARDALLDLAERRSVPRAAAAPVAASPFPAPAHVARLRPVVAGVNRDSSDVPTERIAVRARDVTVHFGGRAALDGASIEAHEGEIIGLIGANGAGKSTLLNVIGGYVRPRTGRIEVLGRDLSGLRPHQRAAVGLGRVFQDARLFGGLTVHEAVAVSLEGREPTSLGGTLLDLPPARRAERRKQAEATEIVDLLGLGRYADTFVSDLSTGTRRIAELACMLGLDARVLLLDEPTAGLAQRETEAFGPLIMRIRDELGATAVVIEHDMPLVMSISHRVYCLAAGAVIAAGPPDDVAADPGVIASYLGTDVRAIRRSGSAAGYKAVPR